MSKKVLSLSLTCWKKRSCMLSSGGDLDYLVTCILLISCKSPPFSFFHPHTFHCAVPKGHIISQACNKESGSTGEGWEQTVRLEGQASGVFLCLLCLFQCAYSGCRPVLSQRALWKDRNVMLLLRHKSWWSLSGEATLCLPSMTPHNPTSSHFSWTRRLQAPGSL